jgi:hypothetical protein
MESTSENMKSASKYDSDMFLVTHKKSNFADKSQNCSTAITELIYEPNSALAKISIRLNLLAATEAP